MDSYSEDYPELETVAPKIESLEIIGEFYGMKKCQIKDTLLLVLSIMSVKHLSSPVLNCKCLMMKTSMEKWNLPGIASLLQSSPYVETLVIDIIFSNHDSEFLDRIYDEVNHWKSKEVYFKSLLQCLKTVKIFGFGERLHTKDVFVLVVEFLLKNAKVLEKMVITEPWVMQNGIHNMQLKFLQTNLVYVYQLLI
ncbi:putative f-box/lrr-repeat protein [Quercus suber]|uniref:F-box/lrr-repeat protein n=1 Tax=Quercus suber TaxID=58331 RepID=A0AAW0KAU9_QUESU